MKKLKPKNFTLAELYEKAKAFGASQVPPMTETQIAGLFLKAAMFVENIDWQETKKAKEFAKHK